jgi:uncharacterized membrane protein YdjX (TVP38/TMEM64 family)
MTALAHQLARLISPFHGEFPGLGCCGWCPHLTTGSQMNCKPGGAGVEGWAGLWVRPCQKSTLLAPFTITNRKIGLLCGDSNPDHMISRIRIRTCNERFVADSPTDKPHPSALTRWLPLAVILVVALIFVLSGAHKAFTLHNLAINKARLEAAVDSNIFLAVVAYILAYIVFVALSLPGALIMTLTGGILFSYWIAVPATVLGATLGATVLFLVARSSLGEAMRSSSSGSVAKLAAGIRADAVSYLLFLRFTPVFPFPLVNLAPAIVGVPLVTFVWTTLVGVTPATLAYTLAAANLDGLIDDKKKAFDACVAAQQTGCAIDIELSTLVSPKLLMAFVALGVVALIPIIARRFANRRNTEV